MALTVERSPWSDHTFPGQGLFLVRLNPRPSSPIRDRSRPARVPPVGESDGDHGYVQEEEPEEPGLPPKPWRLGGWTVSLP